MSTTPGRNEAGAESGRAGKRESGIPRLLLLLLAFSLSGFPAFGSNLIPNSGFEVGFGRGLIQYGTSDSAYLGNARQPGGFLTNDAHSGRFSLVAKGETYTRGMQLTAGDYMFSFWAKASSAGAGPFFFGIMADSDIGNGSVVGTTNIAGAWTRYTLTYTAPSNGFYRAKLFTFQANIDFLIDDLQLELGSSATTYAPASTIELGLSVANTNAVWFAGDSPTLTFNFWNDGVQTATRARYRVYDLKNSNVWSGDLSLTLAAATNTTYVLPLTGLRSGWYRATARLLTANDAGDELAFNNYPYASNFVTHATNDWLGGHSHASLYHVNRELAANRKWTRTLSPNFINTRWDLLEPSRGASYTFYDDHITNLTYQGMNVVATLTPTDTSWPSWATNADGTADMMAWSNYCQKVVAHLFPLGVRWYEVGPNEPYQTGPWTNVYGGLTTTISDSQSGLAYTGTNKPINSRVSTNYARCLAYGIAGATNGNVGVKIVAMAGAYGAGEWADEVWLALTANLQGWIAAVSTHIYPQDNATDPNDGEYAGIHFSNPSGWITRFRSRGVQIWNTESGTYYGPSSFKGMNGMMPIAFDLTSDLGSYPEAWRGETMQRQLTSTARILTEALRCMGYGFDRYFYYDSRYFNIQSFNGSQPYPADFTGVDHPHIFTLSVAASLIRHGTGPATNTAAGPYIEAYACTNAAGNPVMPIWANSVTNYLLTLDNAAFEVLDESGNSIQTNNAAVRLGRIPVYLRSGSRTLAQLSNSVVGASAAVVTDNLAPQVSIDIAPSGAWSGATNAQLFKWTAIDDMSSACPSNIMTHLTTTATNVVYKYKLDGQPYGAYSQSNYVWIPNLAAGDHTFYVTASDAAGNAQEVSHQFTATNRFLNVSGTARFGGAIFR